MLQVQDGYNWSQRRVHVEIWLTCEIASPHFFLLFKRPFSLSLSLSLFFISLSYLLYWMSMLVNRRVYKKWLLAKFMGYSSIAALLLSLFIYMYYKKHQKKSVLLKRSTLSLNDLCYTYKQQESVSHSLIDDIKLLIFILLASDTTAFSNG